MLINLLLKSNDINNIKFAISYLKSLSTDRASLTILKEYLSTIKELIFKYITVDDLQIVVFNI